MFIETVIIAGHPQLNTTIRTLNLIDVIGGPPAAQVKVEAGLDFFNFWKDIIEVDFQFARPRTSIDNTFNLFLGATRFKVDLDTIFATNEGVYK